MTFLLWVGENVLVPIITTLIIAYLMNRAANKRFVKSANNKMFYALIDVGTVLAQMQNTLSWHDAFRTFQTAVSDAHADLTNHQNDNSNPMLDRYLEMDRHYSGVSKNVLPPMKVEDVRAYAKEMLDTTFAVKPLSHFQLLYRQI